MTWWHPPPSKRAARAIPVRRVRFPSTSATALACAASEIVNEGPAVGATCGAMGGFEQAATWLGAVQPVVSGETVGEAVSGSAQDDQEHAGFGFRRIRLADDLAVWELTRTEAGTGLGTGSFDRLLAGWRLDLLGAADDEGVRVCGFSGAEFAFPARASRDLTHWPLLPHRPPTVLPLLLLHPDGRTLLLAPLDAFHEQIGAVAPGRVAVGWHGDLSEVPAGWSTRLAVVSAGGPTAALERWAALVDRRARSRDGDALATRPSYWTDNGAAYWYRTEPGHDVTSGLAATVVDLAARGIPVGAVELDSWWYPHEVLRPVRHRRLGRPADRHAPLGGARRRPPRRDGVVGRGPGPATARGPRPAPVGGVALRRGGAVLGRR